MMNNRLHIVEILKNGESTLGKRKYLINFLSTLFSISVACFGFRVSNTYVDTIISSLSIFTGFYFTLIVYVTDKAVQKTKIEADMKENLTSLYKRFIDDYKNFSKELISQISYSIILAIFLIFLTFLTQYKFDTNDMEGYWCWLDYYPIPINALFLFFSTKLVYFILLIISNMQAFFFEEFNDTNKYL